MINSKPRFALNEDGSLYDYKLGIHHAAVGLLDDGTGVWNLEKVKELIEAGKPIESAFAVYSGEKELQAECDRLNAENDSLKAQLDKVEQAKQSFLNTPVEPAPAVPAPAAEVVATPAADKPAE